MSKRMISNLVYLFLAAFLCIFVGLSEFKLGGKILAISLILLLPIVRITIAMIASKNERDQVEHLEFFKEQLKQFGFVLDKVINIPTSAEQRQYEKFLVDSVNQQFAIATFDLKGSVFMFDNMTKILPFSSLAGFHVIENGSPMNVLRASKIGYCRELKIILRFDDTEMPYKHLDYMEMPILKKSMLYQRRRRALEELYVVLDYIIRNKNQN